MFDNEIVINRVQLAYFARIAVDLAPERHFEAAAGHGHSPAWIVGHLAIVGEMGCSLLGEPIKHEDWLPLFGPGSPPLIEPSEAFALESQVKCVRTAYSDLQRLAVAAEPKRLAEPHGFDLFEDTPIQTVSHLVSVLLTNHFSFHLSQLSSCRRSAGGAPLF